MIFEGAAFIRLRSDELNPLFDSRLISMYKPAPHYQCIRNENSTAMNEMMQETVAERYRIVLNRFDVLWNKSVPGSEAEASTLLREILQLELTLSLSESACACVE